MYPSANPTFITRSFGLLCPSDPPTYRKNFPVNFLGDCSNSSRRPTIRCTGLDLPIGRNPSDKQSFTHLHARDLPSVVATTCRLVDNILATPFSQLGLPPPIVTPSPLVSPFEANICDFLPFFSPTGYEIQDFCKFCGLPTARVTDLCFSRASAPSTGFSHLQQLCVALGLMLSC